MQPLFKRSYGIMRCGDNRISLPRVLRADTAPCFLLLLGVEKGHASTVLHSFTVCVKLQCNAAEDADAASQPWPCQRKLAVGVAVDDSLATRSWCIQYHATIDIGFDLY